MENKIEQTETNTEESQLYEYIQPNTEELLTQHNMFYVSAFSRQFEVNESVIQKIQNIREEDPEGNQISNHGGWQSKSITNKEEYDWLSTIIGQTKFYLLGAYERFGIQAEPKFDNCWFNINKKYSYNSSHTHPGSYFSAIIYLKVPSNSGNLVFERSDTLLDYVVPNEMTPYTSQAFFITPAENYIIIFPSNLKHRVEQNLTENEDDERISIALNFSVER
jgi:uncharacterized protein (TIGR02466 family)